MHMSDSLVSPVIGCSMLVVSGVSIAYSVKWMKDHHFQENKIPLMGIVGAFVFAAQMINFSIPGTGSSGHIVGSILLAALLGPEAAFISLAGVLLVQALLFADGGLLAYGANLFNMGFWGCFFVYPFIFQPLYHEKEKLLPLACIVSSVITVLLGAFTVTLETLASGITELPMKVFLGFMLSIHFFIGIGEGIATYCVLAFVKKNLLVSKQYVSSSTEKKSLKKLSVVLAVIALVLGGAFSLIASSSPDGLEWSVEKTAGTEEIDGVASSFHEFFAMLSQKFTIFPDYSFQNSDAWIGTTISGILGCIVSFLIIVGIIKLVHFFKRDKKNSFVNHA